MTIRDMESRDLEAVVAIHLTAFPGFFLTRMGRPFLRAYYQTVLDYAPGIALVFEDSTDKMLRGFVVGFGEPQGFYTLFSARRRRLLPSILLAALWDPGLVGGILRNMRRVIDQAAHPLDAAELASIGVDGQGRGVGGVLLESFCQRATDAGLRKVVLTTDANENDSVRAFYERRNFALDGFEVRANRRLCRYVRALG